MAMDVENGIRRIHGLDLSKRTFKSCVLTADRNFEDRTVIPGSMDPEGRMKFASTLCKTDLVVMEGGTSSYNFARELIEHTDAEVVVLNPSKLHIIFQSQCKTDKQDCVKLARHVRDTNRENWATLKVPTKEETELRSVINQYDGAVKDRTKAINRLHAIFNQNGFPLLKKADLASNEGRLANITELLDGYAYEVAIVLEREISNCEVNIENYMAMIREIVLKRPKELLIWMSIPGIGLITAASLIAYVGDGERFSKPAELRNYIGLVPKIDQSGDRNIVGKVSAYGCKPVRKNIIQGALSVKNVGAKCSIRDCYFRLQDRGKMSQLIGIGVANKMLTIGHTLLKSGQLYKDFGNYNMLKRKLREAGLGAVDMSMFPELTQTAS